MTQELYSVNDILKYVINKYQLEANNPQNEVSYRQQITRTLKKLDLWDKATIKLVGKKKIHVFSKQQMEELLAYRGMYDYVRENSSSEKIRNSLRYDDIQERIKERYRDNIAYLSSQNMDNNYDDYIDVSKKEFDMNKYGMMLTALFEHFFTPINEELLYDDLYQVLVNQDIYDIQPAVIEAEQRLKYPEGYYYKKRENN